MIERFAIGVLCVLAMCAQAAHAGQTTNDGPLVGLDDLRARIGPRALPTGLGVVAGQVEFPDAQDDYAPNENLDEFAGKTILEMSGPSQTSGHANHVGRNFYGLTISIAPDITDILVWEVNHWIDPGFLHANTPLPPDPMPGGIKILNHSWVATFGFASQNNNALRRLDYVTTRDDVIVTVGVNNDEPNDMTDGQNVALLSHLFNGIAVGVMDGTHVTADTLIGIDAPGRMKPEILAPGSKVSWAIPVVAAGASLMIETASTVPDLAGNPNAQRSEVIKALLLAGANHRTGWTNNPTGSGPDRGVTARPLDIVYGADLLDVNTGHLILTGGEHDGSATPPSAISAAQAGWDLVNVGAGESRYWRLAACTLAPEVSVVATWHRQVESPFGNADWSLANFDLVLWRVDEKQQLVTLVGDPGLPFFADGNVVSQSAVDNIEHLFIRDLEAGEYVLELRRVDAGNVDWDAAVAWHMPASMILGDLDGDCMVGITDFLALLAAWGPCPDPCPPGCAADLDGDCEVGITDFLALLSNWT